MKNLNIKIPDIDLTNPSEITTGIIRDYYDEIKLKFGNFCGDCMFLDEHDVCEKGHKPKKYYMELGPFEYAVLRKKCKDFVLFHGETDLEQLKQKVKNALDSSYQQYC
jgi:hypothetical protein